MGGMILEESKRKAERQAGAHLIDRVSVREGRRKAMSKLRLSRTFQIRPISPEMVSSLPNSFS
jgi:hypothetical protein